MKNSKLFLLLRRLEDWELEEFDDFIRSPYFNKREELVSFFHILRTLDPNFTGEHLDRASVFHELFPQQEFDDKKLAYLMNYLLKLGERFIGQKKYEENEDTQYLDILHGLVDKRLQKSYSFLIKKLDRKYASYEGQDAEFWYNRFKLAMIKLEHFQSLKQRRYDPSIEEFALALDDFFFFEKLKHATSTSTIKDLIKADVRLGMVDEISSYMESADNIPPQIDLYRYLFSAYQNPDSSTFERFLRLLGSQEESMAPKQKRELFFFAINYCGSRIMEGNTSYYSVVLDLYMRGVENKALFENGYLSPYTYTNIVKLCLGLKKIELLEDFLEKNSKYLPPEKRIDAEHLNRAELAYFKKDYEKVFENLNALDHSDFYYSLGSRVLLLKTFYAQNDIEPLLSQITSFNQYLRRNSKLAPSMKKPFENFCKSLALIMRAKPGKKDTIKEKIRNQHPVAEKSWLLETLEKELG